MSQGDLTAIVHASAKGQRDIHNVFGGLAILAGFGFLAALIFIPAKAGEELAKLGVGVIMLAFFAGGYWYIRVANAKLARLVAIILERPGEARAPTLLEFRKGGMLVSYGIALKDPSGKSYRMRIMKEADARTVVTHVMAAASRAP